MKTRFPYEGKIDFEKYWNQYMEREDAIHRLPTEEELKERACKAIVKDHMELLPLPEGEPAQVGDTATLTVSSSLPKFNKPAVTVSLGRGLYNKELETMAIGRKVGDTFTLTIQDETVTVTIQGLKRKTAPEPTDEMVVELQEKDFKGNLITTVADYEQYVRENNLNEKLGNVNYYFMENVLRDYPMEVYEEEDIAALSELEKEFFIKMFKETEGIDLTREVPKEWAENGFHTLEEFIEKRREWYKMKIQQCLIYQNLLNVPDKGKTDPLDHYEVLSELTMMMWEKIKNKLEEK